MGRIQKSGRHTPGKSDEKVGGVGGRGLEGKSRGIVKLYVPKGKHCANKECIGLLVSQRLKRRPAGRDS